MGEAAARPRTITLIVTIAALGCLPIIPGLSNSYWRDEAATATVAARSWGQLFGLLPHFEGGFAGYEIFIHAWASVFGEGELWLRIPSLGAAFGTVVVVGLLADRMGRRWAGPVAAATMALHPYLIPFYGMEARGYALCTFFVSVAALAAHRAARGEGRGSVPIFALAAGVAITMNFLGVLAIIALLGWLFAARGVARRPLSWLLVPLAAAGLMSALTSRAAALQSWLTTPSVWDATVAAARTFTPGMGLFSVALALAAALGRRSRRAPLADVGFVLARATRKDLWVLACWGIGPTLCLLAYSLLVTPALLARYVLSSALPFGVLVGLGFDAVATARASADRASRRRLTAPGGVIVAGALAMAATSIILGSLRPAPKPEDLRAASSYLIGHQAAGDALLYAPSWAELDMRWYLEDRPVGASPPDVAAVPGRSAAEADNLYEPTLPGEVIRRKLRSVDRVWVIGYRVGYHPAPDPGTPIATRIRACWRELDDKPIGVDMELQLWQRPTGASRTTICPS